MADDTTVEGGCIDNEDETAYREEVQSWCTDNNLELNVLKTIRDDH